MGKLIEFPQGSQNGDVDTSLHYLQLVVKQGFVNADPNAFYGFETAGLIDRWKNKFLKGISIALPISVLMWLFIFLGFKRLLF